MPRSSRKQKDKRERTLSVRSLRFLLPAAALMLACASVPPTDGGNGPSPVADPESLAATGQLAADGGDYALAKELYDAALAEDPGNEAAYRGLAGVCAATNDPVSAIYYYEKLLELPGNEPADHVELSRLLEKSGRNDEGVRLLKNAVRTHPDDARLRAELGSRLLATGRTEGAIPQLRRAVELGAEKNTHRQLASTLFRMERYDDALDVLLSYDQRYPGDFGVNMNLAYIYFDRGDHEAALPFYRAAVVANPKSIDARVGLAKTLEALGRTDNAIRVYDQTLEIRGLVRELEPVIVAQANLLIKRGKYDRALELVQSASDGFPETPGLACARGMALAGQGRYQEAVSAFSLATGDPKWSQFASAQIRRIESILR